MKKITQSTDDKLLSYLDKTMDTRDKVAFEIELSQDEALRERLDQLEEVHRTMRAISPSQPSRNFTQLVMQKLDQYPAQSTHLSVRGGILLLAGVLVAAGIAAVLVSGGVFDNAFPTLDLNQVDLELTNRYFEKSLPSIPFDGKLIVNSIIVLNLGLAWLVLDRAILKPLFQRRMQGGH